MMDLKRSGVIVFTEQYEVCVDFYRRILELPELFSLDNEHSTLTCLDMGGSYLMIETGGTAMPGGRSIKQCPVKLRFNVPDVDSAARILEGARRARCHQAGDLGNCRRLRRPGREPLFAARRGLVSSIRRLNVPGARREGDERSPRTRGRKDHCDHSSALPWLAKGAGGGSLSVATAGTRGNVACNRHHDRIVSPEGLALLRETGFRLEVRTVKFQRIGQLLGELD